MDAGVTNAAYEEFKENNNEKPAFSSQKSVRRAQRTLDRTNAKRRAEQSKGNSFGQPQTARERFAFLQGVRAASAEETGSPTFLNVIDAEGNHV